MRFSSLFRASSGVPADRAEGRTPPGLRLLPDFVTAQVREEIEAWIAANVTWSGGSFGGNRKETYLAPTRPLPEWGQMLGRRMRAAGIFDDDPDFCQILSYQAGQGIRRHVDKESLGEVVVGLTLGSSRVFEFSRAGKRDEHEFALEASKDVSARVLLMPGDVYVMAGESRHQWEHGVPFTNEDHFNGRAYPRCDGCSVIWRRVDRNAAWVSEFERTQPSAHAAGKR